MVTSHGSRAVHKDRPVRNAFDQVGLAEAVQKAFGEAVLFDYFFSISWTIYYCARIVRMLKVPFFLGKLKRFCFQYEWVEVAVGDAFWQCILRGLR